MNANVIPIRHFSKTRLFDLGFKLSEFFAQKRLYEANIFIAMEVPKQLQPQVSLIARTILKNKIEQHD